jgi:peptide-methionine (R)-S-oxide reductase
MAETKVERVHKTEAEWRELLTPEQFHVMREGGTERAFTGALVNNHDDGIYHCGACNAPLFTSDKKFESGSGWPSFWNPVSAEAIEAVEDTSHGMKREVRDLRGSPGACVSGWAETYGVTVLHQ